MKSDNHNEGSAHVPVAAGEKVCTGRDLAEALAGVELSEEEAKAWNHDLQAARRMLKPPSALESARELASMGGTMPHLKKIPRRRMRPK